MRLIKNDLTKYLKINFHTTEIIFFLNLCTYCVPLDLKLKVCFMFYLFLSKIKLTFEKFDK